MLLLHPPIAKPCEPPAGVAHIAGALHAAAIPYHIVDLSIAAFHYLLGQQVQAKDNWTRRAAKNSSSNCNALCDKSIYRHPARYQKSVHELNRIITHHSSSRATASLVNYQDSTLSPLSSSDLLNAAESPESNLFYSFYVSQIPGLLEEYHPQYIGISMNFLSQALCTFSLIGYLKKIAPGVPLILGGGLLTSWMRNPGWTNPFQGLIDHCIEGCGVAPLLGLLGAEGRDTILPRFDDLTANCYLSPGFVLPYSSSSGCYWNKCSFCPERAEKNPFSMRGDLVTKDIQRLVSYHSPALLHLLDNAVPPKVLAQLTEEPPGVPWYGFVRITKQLLDLDYCLALKRSGCVMLKLGVESGDQEVLDQLNKGVSVRMVSTVLKNLHRAGIGTYVYLLFGTPAENQARAERTLDFCRRHHHFITFLNLAIFNMPTASEEKDALQTSNFYDGDLSLYTDFAHPEGWNRKHVRLFLERQFKKEPVIGTILQRDPPYFTSNHAPFFCSADYKENG